MPSCPKCGAALSRGELKCPACGAEIPQEKENPAYEPWFSSIILEPGETVLKSWRGDNEVPAMVAIRGIPQQAKIRKTGYLVLTNRKIFFVEERGFFQTSYHVSITIKLEDIEGISM